MPYVSGYGTGFGGVLAAPIWHDYMLLATQGMLAESFALPSIGFYAPAPPSPPSPSPSPSTSPTAATSPTPTSTPTPTPEPTLSPHGH